MLLQRIDREEETSGVPAHGVDVWIAEHLVALFANPIKSRELGLVVDTHAAQADEAPLVQVGGSDAAVLVHKGHDGEDQDEESGFNDGRHDRTFREQLSAENCREYRFPTQFDFCMLVLPMSPFYTSPSSF